MKLDSLRPLLDHDGPLTTVCMDVTRADEAGDREIRNRWSALKRALDHQKAPAETVDTIADVLLRPTHVPGPHGRFVVASGTEILFDRVLADAPVHEEAFHDGVPSLMPAAQAIDEAVRYLLVEIDRTGADLTWSGVDLPDEEVVGGHDVLHKARAGGWSHRRIQTRAEDSWERNVGAVAAELDRLVGLAHPEVVLVTGDVRAVAMLRDEVGKAVAEVLVEVPGGSRADGVKEDVFAARLHEAMEAYRARRREAVVDRLREALGRGAGVTALDDVVDVLRRGQVAELVIVEDAAGNPPPLGERELWVGQDALALGTRRSEIEALGQDPRRLRADIALLRCAVGQDAGVTFAVEGSISLVDGVGAVLRWTDPATPHETAPAYTADRHRKSR
ncbi:Vms1/Ankzf1 family peptidyl-tRNA hydrolase [Isoptericola sp. b441]|uniref:Vms1/Ankzf1 family peptidyl-tRNA hydrolase n=1 Tax=Actinotalea lenta TaxID=3064654 RepID=A0ABT9DDB7_9CELL|nr:MULTISPECIES: Vms1/Ankzf1 family peptidyl-tRNA hydrolase [unclassified Isoptericola]MDO8107278.1 Vms1/Ankzf1 family peptidyl-tRNA hydrolase [Isoptericola sp. b441]MDO8121060.1 Vms1/Ankzf1 family peptidyl-tRNA hydrolase [Isoptericola sp. b490]